MRASALAKSFASFWLAASAMISSERAWGRRLGTTSTLLWWVLCGRLARHGCPSQVATRAEQELLSAARRARLGSVWQPLACVYWRTRRYSRPELASLGTLHGAAMSVARKPIWRTRWKAIVPIGRGRNRTGFSSGRKNRQKKQQTIVYARCEHGTGVLLELHNEHRLFRGALSRHRPLEPCPRILL